MEDEQVTVRLTLEDIIPEKPEFTLKSTGKTYRLRFPDLDDQVWFKRVLGSQEAIGKIMGERNWREIGKVIYYLLEDKSDFAPYDAKETSDDGEPVDVRITGPRHLLKKVQGIEEGFKMLGALNKAMIGSSPIVDEYVRSEIKKNIKLRQIGGKFLTSSPVSTVGQTNTSEAAP